MPGKLPHGDGDAEAARKPKRKTPKRKRQFKGQGKESSAQVARDGAVEFMPPVIVFVAKIGSHKTAGS